MNLEEGAEDLLIRARRNELTGSDERRLEIALGSSRELELLYRAGVEFDASAGLLAGDETRLDALVLGALARLESDSGAVNDGEYRPAASKSVQRRLAGRYFAAGLACSLLFSVAMASAWDYVEQRRALAALEQRVARLAARPAQRAANASAASKPNPTLPAAETALVPAPSASAARALTRPRSAPGKTDRVTDEPSEAQLFTRANELRRQGNADGAIALYRRLGEHYPNSAEAGDAKVLLGELLLGQRASRAALEQFDGYGSGALGLEALWGKAQALRSLGSPDERAALERLVRDYPSSPFAGAARKRLRELSP